MEILYLRLFELSDAAKTGNRRQIDDAMIAVFFAMSMLPGNVEALGQALQQRRRQAADQAPETPAIFDSLTDAEQIAILREMWGKA